jgi:glutamate-1-semialdehyde 2,1-aminomutase
VVIDDLREALARGTSYGAPTEREIVFAEAIRDAMPSIERLRMTSSGSEAVMGAVRLARAATGREVIVKTEGGYHGAIDGLLAQAGSGATTLGVPTSPGVTAGATAATRLVPYNDLAAAEVALEGAAAIILEPVAGNMGVVPPAPGYLEGLRAACDRTGALLILDEVITGFRVARGGAGERFGVKADLTCMGKVIGGGLPVGAFGGRADVMRELAPEGPCYQAGTLSGNPLATTAGLAVICHLAAEGTYKQLEENGARLEAVIRESGALRAFL